MHGFLTPGLRTAHDRLLKGLGGRRKDWSSLLEQSALFGLVRQEVAALGHPLSMAPDADKAAFATAAWIWLLDRLAPDSVDRACKAAQRVVVALRGDTPDSRDDLSSWTALGDLARTLEPLLARTLERRETPPPRAAPRLGTLLDELLFRSPYPTESICEQARRQHAEHLPRPSDPALGKQFIREHLNQRHDDGTRLLLAAQVVLLLRNCEAHPGPRLRDDINDSSLHPVDGARYLIGLLAWVALRTLAVRQELGLDLPPDLWMPAESTPRPPVTSAIRARLVRRRTATRRAGSVPARILVVVALLAVAGAGVFAWQRLPSRAPAQPVAPPQTLASWAGNDPDYRSACLRERKELERLRASRDQREFRMGIRLIAGMPPKDEGRILKDVPLADALVEGSQRRVLVLGQGGTGKSVLARVLRALACERLPTFLLELDVIAPSFGAGPVDLIDAVLRHASDASDASGPIELERMLRHDPWLLILDGLDELPRAQRDRVVAAANDLMSRHPGPIRIAATGRPPVFGPRNYGLKMDTEVQLLPLSCGEAEDVARQIVTSAQEYQKFRDFLGRYGFLRMQPAIDGCRYVHMTTYREVHVLVEAFRSGFAGNATRARAFTGYVENILGYLLKTREAGVADLLPVIDRMTADSRGPDWTSARALRFTAEDCRRAVAAEVASRPHAQLSREDPVHACERLLSSGLFEPSRDAGTTAARRFRDEILADLFVARMVESRLHSEAPAGCDALDDAQEWFRVGEVPSFLVGMPNGQRCFLPLLSSLCAASADPTELIRQFRQGLPPGAAGRRTVTAAAQALGEEADDACATQVLAALGDPGPDTATPQVTGSRAPPSPAPTPR